MAGSTVRIVNDKEWSGYFVEQLVSGGRWDVVAWRFTLWGARFVARRINGRRPFVEYF